MQDELARIAVGLPVASVWPLTVPYLAKSRPRVILATFLSALYVLAPQIPDVSALLLLAAATGTSFALWSPDDQEEIDPEEEDMLATYSPALAAFLLGLIAIALLGFDVGQEALEGVVESNHVALVATGLIGAVFVGGSVVAWILKPFTRALEESGEAARLPGLSNAGRYIGWFERALLFAFVIGGEPEAAAVALAAKSFARFPTLSEHHEGFAEYFLIGSLASLTIAVAVAAATRAALGIGPF